MLTFAVVCLAVAAAAQQTVLRDDATRTWSADKDAGKTTSAVFPPEVTETFDADAYFTTATEYAGPSLTGDEPMAIETAHDYARFTQAFPLVQPLVRSASEGFNALRHWGNLSPYNSVQSHGLGALPLVPSGCVMEEVHLLHRHGARYPEDGDPSPALAQRIHKIVKSGKGFTATGELEFLNRYMYKLGSESLSSFGREQLFNLGIGFRFRYGGLLKGFTKRLPVFRTTSQWRMLNSALNFAAGFFGIPFEDQYHQLVIIEDKAFNSTLSPQKACTNTHNKVGQFGTHAMKEWSKIFLKDAKERLQFQVQGFDLKYEDLLGMMETCAYETVALGSSDFCPLFTEDEFRGYDYYCDLKFWYNSGFGSPVGAAHGIGWVQELVARLTHVPIATHNSSTNATLDDSPITFPLHQRVYVDATHDTIITGVVAALNFTEFARRGPLPLTHIPKQQSFRISEIAPFGGNLVAQVMSCPTAVSSLGTDTVASADGRYIRWVLNDAVVPLTGVRGCSASALGLCALDAFVDGMRARIAEVDFGWDCFGNYSLPEKHDIVDGRAPRP